MAKKKGMSRRDFFRVSWLAGFGTFMGGFTFASLGLLWPSLRGGFGSKINLGKAADIKSELAGLEHQIKYYPEARTYLILYHPKAGQDKVYAGIAQDGLLASYQKCAHLGCKVPICDASGWLECPCHGSRYNKAGEYQFGPAPKGLSHFPLVVEGSDLIVDTAAPSPGPPRGTDTIGQAPEGPHCQG